jgi:hypothetical protein
LSKELADVYIEDNSVVVSAGIVDLSNPKNPPRDQGNEASIVGFSVASALEIEITRKFGYAVQISPRYIYNSIGGTAHSGARIEDALDLAKNIGVIEESVWPYTSNDYHNMISKLRADTTSNRYKIQAFYPLKPGSIEQFKKVLKQGSSIIAGIRLPDYFSSDVSGNWRLRGSSFNYAGSISICIVGYDDATKRFKFKNSWGANWGDEGYGYLRYDDLFIILHSAYYLEM